MGLTTVQTVTAVCAMIAAVGGIIALIFKFVRWVDRQKEQDAELKALKISNKDDIDKLQEELAVLCYAILACLDGLKQLGANGNVTKAHDALDKHLNQKAHRA